MKRSVEEELDEQDLLFDEECAPDEEEAGSSEQEEQEATARPSTRGRALEGPGSNKSATTLQDINEDEAVDGFHATTKPVPVAGSLPAAQHIRMGSSVPMNIPFLGAPKPTRNVLQGEDEEEPQYPGTFIPPHQLSQHDGHFMFSLSGRERLRARNAILKSTGFLEHTAGVPVQERSKLTAMAAGGLSQALHSNS